jgi:hypothetical protein
MLLCHVVLPLPEKIPMKTLALLLLSLSTLLLSGCASTIRSNVAVFHEWPAEATQNSFVLEPPAAQEDGIEYTQYQNLLRRELVRLGMADAAATGQSPTLKVSMHYSTTPVEVHAIVADPFFFGPGVGYRRPFGYYPYWYRTNIGPGYTRYYPASSPLARDEVAEAFRRKLQIGISRIADGKKLYEVTVDNGSDNEAQNEVMPYMIQSAFAQFPGESGKPYRVVITLKQDEAKSAVAVPQAEQPANK